MTPSKPPATRTWRRLASAAILAAALAGLSACGAKTPEAPPPDEPASNPGRDEALSFQNLPWMPTANPSVWPLGPLTDMAQNEASGTWTMALTPEGYRVTNAGNNQQNFFLRRSMEGPTPPGYRATAYIRTHDLRGADAAAGMILASASPEEMVILALNGDNEVMFYTVDGGQISEPTSLQFSGDLKGTDHMLQAIVTGNKAALFVDGQYAGLVEGAASFAASQGMGLFVTGKSDVTLNAFTLDLLPTFQPPGGPPRSQ